VTDRLGGQNAFAAGGRYDNLVAEFGGRPTPAVGFAAGVERMELLLEGADIPGDGIDAFIAHTGGAALERAVSLVRELRAAGLSADLDPATKGFKAQFKKADREGASFVLVIGEDEISAGTCTVKALESGAQETVPAHSVAAYLRNRLGR